MPRPAREPFAGRRAAVCCEAAYTLLGKRASERADPILVAFLAAALALPLFLPFAIWQWRDFSPSWEHARMSGDREAAAHSVAPR